MAKSSAFSFTNTTAQSGSITPIALGLVSNYAVAEDTANMAVLNNKTALIDAQELVSYKSTSLKEIKNGLNIQYPAPTTAGLQYSVQVEETLVTTDSADPSFRVDEPIICNISFRHNKSGNISSTIMVEVLKRAVSALMHDNGTWRFDDLMRSAERPVTD